MFGVVFSTIRSVACDMSTVPIFMSSAVSSALPVLCSAVFSTECCDVSNVVSSVVYAYIVLRRMQCRVLYLVRCV